MGILDKFKRKDTQQTKPQIKSDTTEEQVNNKEAQSTVNGAKDNARKKSDSANPDKDTVASASEKMYADSKAKQIIVRPLITEKATMLGTQNKYLFEVHPDTNKVEVKKEMERLYNVKPLDVHVVNHRGNAIKYGRRSGKTKHWKKAIVTLKAGDHIESKVGA